MSLRYLFGPVSRTFAEQNLARLRERGDCLAFNSEDGADLTIRPGDGWEQVRAQLPAGWQPDFLALYLAYSTTPDCLWSLPLPRVALAPDWHLLWHGFRRRLRGCDRILTDTPGAECLNREGLMQARPGQLFGCDQAVWQTEWPEGQRDIDLLLIGNLNPAVQSRRLPWLTRLAALGQRWRVLVRTGVFGDSYRAAGPGPHRLSAQRPAQVRPAALRGGRRRGPVLSGGRQPRIARLLPRPPGVRLLHSR